MGMDGDHYQADPMKSPLFECFLRMHQLNHICTRLLEEYRRFIQKEEEQEKTEPEEVIKSESESEDSFLSADMSADDNVLVGPSKAFVEETSQENQVLKITGTEIINFLLIF